MTQTHSVIIVLAFLALALPYVQRAKHPDYKVLAAYLLFVSTWVLSAAVVYVLLVGVASVTGISGFLSRPEGTLLSLALIFVPAFFLARWLIKRRPRRMWAP
jgi:uncharacterized membrane protein